ncbi:MAG TPA: ABC transporter substrate-binding protein [Actinomycetota bacterium]|jgi:branched-chain amino acid transport system substrate-binding protein|nr:ABC transporter substrate-binding protein [Actinomycetota bacterium]
MGDRALGTGSRITRRQLLTGAGGAAIGGLVVGGIGGYAIGSSGDDDGGGGGGTGGGEPIRIGSASPVSGAYSGDGQEMTRGQELAIAYLNANGGVLGRQLELVVADVEDLAPEKMVNAARRLTNEGVAAVFSGYTSTSSTEFDVYADYGAPMFHLNTFQPNADYVADNQIPNIYHSCPTEVWYGPGFIQFMQRLIDAGSWEPSSETAAIVTSNDPYSISIARTVRGGIEELGWEVTTYEQVTAPLTEWGPVLSKIRQDPPGLIFHSDYIPGDLASFQQQFRSDPTRSLMYQQYGPSIPEYLELAGADADGVIWSTVIGTLPDQIGQAFKDAYREEYGAEAGLSQAGGQYDLVQLWAQAAAMAGDPLDFEQVNANIKRMLFRGVSGTYRYRPGELTAIPYPDEVNDPSLGMPHLTFQIQNQEQVLIDPEPYSQGQFELPSWL